MLKIFSIINSKANPFIPKKCNFKFNVRFIFKIQIYHASFKTLDFVFWKYWNYIPSDIMVMYSVLIIAGEKKDVEKIY